MKYIITIQLCLFCLFTNAQELTLDQLTSYINQPLNTIHKNLEVKGWALKPELSAFNGNQLYQTYAFGKLATDETQALAWFRIHAFKDVVKQVYYQLPGLDAYEKLLKQLKSVSTLTQNGQSIEDKQIGTLYENKDYNFQTLVGGGSYTLMVTTK